MEKEFEALEKAYYILKDTANGLQAYTPSEISNACDVVNQALLELKAIKEAKPSETLGELETLKELVDEFVKLPKNKIINRAFDDIKQALLNAQEQEKENSVLKACIKDWEDDYKHLEFALHKEKGVNVGEFKKELDWDKFDYSFYLCYYKRFSIEELTKEEFDTLKRWSEK